MNQKKMQQWEKWHNRGYKKFMLINMGGVCAFYAFSGTIAITQLYMTMPKSVKEKGGALPLFMTALLIIAILVPAAFLFMHITWKMKEAKYNALLPFKEIKQDTEEEGK